MNGMQKVKFLKIFKKITKILNFYFSRTSINSKRIKME